MAGIRWWVSTAIVSLCVAAACASPARAQDGGIPPVAYPALPAHAVDAAGFVPGGWRLEQAHEGDLDGDGRSDMLLVLRMHDPANVIARDGGDDAGFDTNPRMLAIAFARPAGGYRLVLQDHALIPRADNANADEYLDGDDAVAIRDGRIFVRLHWWLSMGGWGTSSTTYTFRWQDGCMRLIGYDLDEIQRNSGETIDTSINYLAGEVRIDSGSIEDDRTRTRRETFPPAAAKCLQDIGDGFEFDPGVNAGT